MGAAAEHALATADPTDVRARSVAAHDGVIRPARRDTVFRRLLGVADILAAVGGLLVLGCSCAGEFPP